MNYYLDNNSLIITFDKEDKYSWKYYYTYQPYLYSNHNTITIKEPLLKSNLIQFKEWFNINDTNIDNYINNFNVLESLKCFSLSQYEQLRDYQNIGVDWTINSLELNKFAFLFWDMRTGKTITSTTIAKQYNKTIILCLSGQEDNWISTLKDINYSGKVLYPKLFKDRKEMYKEFNAINRGIMIVSMNSLSLDISYNDNLISYYDLIIIDEIHKIKNPKTSIYQNTKKVVRYATYKLGLTGTPVSKHEIEVIPMFSLFNTKLNKTYLTQYFFDCNNYSFNTQWNKTYSLKDENKWLEFLNTYSYQVKKEEVLTWVVEPNVETVYLDMDETQTRAYNLCWENFQIDRNIINQKEELGEIIAQMIRLRQLTIHPILLNNNGRSVKEEWILNYIVSNPEEKIIIFTTFSSYIPILKDTLELFYNKKVLTITGRTKNKTKISQQFNNGDIDIIIANIQAGSKGLSLDSADTLIFLDKDWRPDENKQASERLTATDIDRVKPQKIYNLIVKNSIDEHINEVLEHKKENTELINNYKKLLLEKE